MRIEDVHAYLDQIEEVIAYLDSTSEERVPWERVDALGSAVRDIVDLRTAYVDGPKLGIHPTILNRYIKFRDDYEANEARIVAQRVRSYLRNLDQAAERSDPESALKPLPSEPPAAEPLQERGRPRSEQMTVQAEGWKLVGPSSDLKVKILALSMLLDQIIETARGSNAPPERQVLSQLERAQIITILETALSLLKAPMVETGLLKKAGRMLGKVAKRAAAKEMEEGLGSLAEMAANELTDIISNLPG
jgi:hypothetical protein